ncbi:MAG: hypothetical protein CMC55_08105 [Flavobacteriaceae bacterium]|uniref:hypothetical protein n=1 Tax=Bizionia echini TaxID=649333 RepID=UPI000C930256|nr:hypothetical protein [Flavobacteriaceae bacterium]
MSKKYYKDAFAIDKNSFKDVKEESEYYTNPFLLNNYDYYEPKLIEDFYIKYFTKILLFEIDILELKDFLEYHFDNCINSDSYIMMLELKIIPKTKEIIENAVADLEPNQGFYKEIKLDDGFVETEGVIKNSKYEYGIMLHYTAVVKCQNDLKKRAEIIASFLKNLNTNTRKDNLEWAGKPSHVAYIISRLVDEGYIAAPLKNDGEINYTELSRQILNSFDFKQKIPSIESLRRYSNEDSDKFLLIDKKFKNEGFHIPNLKIMS